MTEEELEEFVRKKYESRSYAQVCAARDRRLQSRSVAADVGGPALCLAAMARRAFQWQLHRPAQSSLRHDLLSPRV
jgi:hypothetical protein